MRLISTMNNYMDLDDHNYHNSTLIKIEVYIKSHIDLQYADIFEAILQEIGSRP